MSFTKVQRTACKGLHLHEHYAVDDTFLGIEKDWAANQNLF